MQRITTQSLMIFLTGSTGFLGREILCRLLHERPQERIALLIRPSLQESAEQRAKNILRSVFGTSSIDNYWSRIEIINGDVTEDCFGLGEEEFRSLASRIHSVYHCAASTSLDQELQRARSINVGGTFQILKFSEKAHQSCGADFRLFHVSTAYVAGQKTGVFQPSELCVDGPFKNAYERSKAESEAMVRSMQDRIPLCIFRPSVVVGDSITGETSAFNVIYIPAKLFVKGFFRLLPGSPTVPFDLVPVDYAADAIVYLSLQAPTSGSCYYISAGVGREPSLWEIIETLISTFNNHRKLGRSLLALPQRLPPEILSLAQSSLSNAIKAIESMVTDRINVFRQTAPFIPYMFSNPQFDDASTRRALLNSGIAEAPLFQTYAERLFQYCLDTNWGKNPWTNPRNFLLWHQRVSQAGLANIGS